MFILIIHILNVIYLVLLKVIKGTFKYACYILNYINDDPAERVHLPRMETINHDPAHIFTPEEIERILNRFKDTHSIYYSFLTAYYTGMKSIRSAML
jgi:hypothetical protein